MVEVHFEDFVFRVAGLDDEGEDEFFTFTLESAFVGEKCVFDELLGDGGASLGTAFGDELAGSTDESDDVDSSVGIELFVFDGDSGLLKVVG